MQKSRRDQAPRVDDLNEIRVFVVSWDGSLRSDAIMSYSLG